MRKWLANVLLVMGSSAAAVVMLEVGLRIAGVSYPNLHRTDPDRGFALRPGAEGPYTSEGSSYVRINSDGLRDREHPLAKPANTLRIAVIGDSFTEALQVPAEDAYWSVMERRLRQCPAVGGRQVEAINFGVAGYGTEQELITLRKHAWKYHPDVVLLAVTTGNDVKDNSPVLATNKIAPFVVERDGRTVLDTSFHALPEFRFRQSFSGRVTEWLLTHSRIAQVVNEARHSLNVPKSVGENQSTGELSLFAGIYREPADSTWASAWAVTEHLISAMHRDVAAHGAKFFVMTTTTGPQVHPDRAVREEFLRRSGNQDLLYPEKRLQGLASREGFPILTLAPAFQAYAERNHAFLHGFGHYQGHGHWNALGHHMAGEMLARSLCEELSRPRPGAAPGAR